jgi:hypothetical protein
MRQTGYGNHSLVYYILLFYQLSFKIYEDGSLGVVGTDKFVSYKKFCVDVVETRDPGKRNQGDQMRL